MGRILLPTDYNFNGGVFEFGIDENSSNQLKLRQENSQYDQYGMYTSGVHDLGAGQNTRLVDITRPASDPGSIDIAGQMTSNQILQRASGSAPTYLRMGDDFGGRALNTNRWSIAHNTNGTYSVSDGSLHMSVGSSDGDELWIRHGRTFTNINTDKTTLIVRVRPQTFPASGSGEHLFGIWIGIDPPTDLFTVSNEGTFAGLRYTSTDGLVYFCYRGTYTNPQPVFISQVPDVVEFIAGAPTSRTLAGYRIGSKWSILDTYTGGSGTNASRINLILYNRTADGNTLSVDVEEVRSLGFKDTETYASEAAQRPVWAMGESPSERDDRWASTEFIEDWSEYTDNLDCEPSASATWEDIPEGMVASGTSGYKFCTQPQIYVSTGHDTADYDAQVSQTNGYFLADFTSSAPDGKEVALRWDVGRGIARPMERGTLQIPVYYYRSDNNLLDGDKLYEFEFLDEDGRLVIAWYIRATVVASNLFRMCVRNPTETVDSTNVSKNFTGGGSWTMVHIMYWDCTNGASFSYHNQQGNTNVYFGGYGSYFGIDGYGATTGGYEHVSSRPVASVIIRMWHKTSTSDATQFRIYRPALLREPVMLSADTLPSNSFNEYLVPWRHPTEGTNQESYYQSGRYSQFRMLMEGA